MRLARFGHRNLPFYRIFIADGRAPRDGKHIEVVGRGLHSSTFQLNLSALYRIRGARVGVV
jgi:ribosomal protein S16